MKKLIIAFAVLVSLCACSKKDADTQKNDNNTMAQAAKPADAQNNAEAPKNAEPADAQAVAQAKDANNADADDKSGTKPDTPVPVEEKVNDKAGDAAPDNATIDEKMASIKWEKGGVDRFLFAYEVPAFMQKQPAPDNNDGATYIWKELTFKVWGANDMHDGSAKAAFDEDVRFLGHAPHYKVVKSNYYIISDYEENNIFYRKCVFNNSLEYCEEVSYPQSYKAAVDPIVKKIAAFDVPKMEMEEQEE